MTEWEVRHGIHKDGNDAILNAVPMLDLGSGEQQPSLTRAVSSDVPTVHRQTIQFVQKNRAAFLSVSSNETSTFAIHAHSDPVPKELMRHFATATSDLGSNEDHASLSRGLSELSLALAEYRNGPDTDPMTRYARWLEVRQGARGKVDSIITAERYLLTNELIFDRIAQQYNSNASMRVVASAPRDAANVAALPAQFLITTKGKLGRTVKDNIRAVANARANMAVRAHPPFEVRFETTAEAKRLMETADDELTNAEHARKLTVFRDQAMMTKRQLDLTKGLSLLLWYGGTLLANRNEREFLVDLERAIRSWISMYMKYGFGEYGGSRDAWHADLYPKLPAAFTFSTHAPSTKALKIGEIGLSGEVANFPNAVLAVSFVPNLISMWLRREERFSKLSAEDRDAFFMLNAWLYGQH
jgi:hypothetical protein